MKKVVAGIVLFNPQINRLKENIEAIVSQVEKVILFDNGSSNFKTVGSIVSKNHKLVLIHSNHNIGIAAALNNIFKYAEQKFNPDFVLTIDQDSVCSKNLIHEYLKFYDPKIGIYSPEIRDINVVKHTNNKSKNVPKISEVKECITSASLTNYKAWKSVNGFDETMFIDNVDFDFCKRIRKKGYKIIRVNTVFIRHELGHIKEHNTVFGKVLVKNHNSFRKYYIARNTIYMARKDSSFIVKFIAYLRIIKQLLLVLGFEQSKASKIRSLLKGTLDGQKIEIKKKWR